MENFSLVKFVKQSCTIEQERTDLTICITKDGFLFSLIEGYDLRALGEFKASLLGGITSVMSSIRDCLNSIDIRLFNFANIRIVSLADKDVFVPYKLYEPTKMKDYLRSVAHISGNETILDSVSSRLNAVSVFSIPMQQHSGIKILMPKAKFLSQHQIMAEYCFDIAQLSQNTAILYKREKKCDLVIFKNTEFVFSNTFEFSTQSDMIYQILFVFDKLQIDSEEIIFLITGQDFTMEEKHDLKKYIKNVSYTNTKESINISNEFDGINIQNYFLSLVK
ncbi:MAG: DUF3822 family protein [Bacteroidales bacterium]|jgi:hypothetical protein|nr:DUF3822 family protein [Bacteroidales bacterium]